MNLLRPRYTAAATGAFFAIVLYLAWDTARQTTGVWYDPPMSQTVYQTSLVAGVLILAGLMVVASMHPRIDLATPSQGRKARRRALREALDAASEMAEAPANAGLAADDAYWGRLERLLDVLENRSGTPARNPTRLADPPETDAGPAHGTWDAQVVSVFRASAGSDEVVPTRPLAEYVTEIRELLLPARRAGLRGADVWHLAGEPSVTRGTDLAERTRLAEHVKETLVIALDHRIRVRLEEALTEVQTVNAAAKQARSAELVVAEAGTLFEMGRYLAALDRLDGASRMLRTRIPADEAVGRDSGTSCWVVLAGPALIAIAYVAASSMLLPGVGGFLVYHYVFNTTVVLVLSYGWVGLLVYALVSVYMTLSAASRRSRARTSART